MKESTSITMKDIARELGVSVATVSRALKDSPRISLARREMMAQGGLSVAGGCRCLTKDGNTSIEKEGYIPYPLQA